MTGDWLDRAARFSDERVSRRRALQLAGAAALTVGPLASLSRPTSARAGLALGENCRPQCLQTVRGGARNAGAHCGKIGLVAGYAVGNPLAIAYGAGCIMAAMYETATEQARCYQPNCGNPPGSPPPPAAPAPSAAPATPPSHPDPEWPKKKKKKKKKGIKRKPPPKPDPCKDCTNYCSPCASTSSGYICCLYPMKNGRSPCCP